MATRYRACALLVSLLLAGCAGRPAPPGSIASWRHETVPGVTFDHPVNWPVARREVDRNLFLVVAASEHERLVITRLPDQAGARLDAFAAAVEQRVQQDQPEADTSAATPATIAGRRALRLTVTLGDQAQGTRWLITGGWLVEAKWRHAHAATVESAFESLVASLTLPEEESQP